METADFNAVLRSARDFVRREVVPAESEVQATNKVPNRIRDKAKAMGLFGYAIPEQYGGMGLSMSKEALGARPPDSCTHNSALINQLTR